VCLGDHAGWFCGAGLPPETVVTGWVSDSPVTENDTGEPDDSARVLAQQWPVPNNHRDQFMYYTYLLKSSIPGPNGSDVIYVGKGKGIRMEFHVPFALNGYRNRKDSKLYNKIRSIVAAGGSVQPEKVFESKDEAKAFEKEVELIRLYGIKNLCNLTLGGEGATKHDYRPIAELVSLGLIRLSPEHLTLLGGAFACSPATCRNAGGVVLPSAASVVFETLPEGVKDIISAPHPPPRTTPFVFDTLPLCEVITCIKYRLPNYHYHCAQVFYRDEDWRNCSSENLVFFHPNRIRGAFPKYVEVLADELQRNCPSDGPLGRAVGIFLKRHGTHALLFNPAGLLSTRGEVQSGAL
jgi:hypothetical protein